MDSCEFHVWPNSLCCGSNEKPGPSTFDMGQQLAARLGELHVDNDKGS